jgi:hypothetical protein
MRYSECYVRGLKAFASASSPEVWRGIQDTLYSHATTITETNPAYTYSWTSVPPGFTSSLQNPIITPAATATYIVNITDTNTGCSDTASVTVSVIVTGIGGPNGKDSELVIYPNPTEGIVNIKGAGEKNLEITVCNVYGETLLKVSDSPAIDLSGFAKGIYFLTVRSGGKKISNYKIIKIE